MIQISELKPVKLPEDPHDRNVVFYNNKELEGFDDGLLDMAFADSPGEIQKQFDIIKRHYPKGFSNTFLKYAAVINDHKITQKLNELDEKIEDKKESKPSNSDGLTVNIDSISVGEGKVNIKPKVKIKQASEEFKFGDRIKLKTEPPYVQGIFLEVQDSKPGDIDFLIYFPEPQHNGFHVIEVPPTDVVRGEGEASKEEIKQAKDFYKEYKDNIKAYQDKFKDEVKEEVKEELQAKAKYNLQDFLEKHRQKSTPNDVNDLRTEQSAIPDSNDYQADGSMDTYFKLNKLDSDSKYSKEDSKMINWKRKAEKVDPAKYISEGEKGGIKTNPSQDAFKVNVSQQVDKSAKDLLDHSTVISKNESQMTHKSSLVTNLDKKIAELQKIKEQAIKLEAAEGKSVNPGDKQFREDGHKEKLNYNPGEAKVDTGKQSGMSSADANKPLSKGTVEKLEYPTSIKDGVKDIPHAIKTEKAEGHKDNGTKEKIMPNKSFHSEPNVNQQTDKTLGNKFRHPEEKTKPFQKQFSFAGITWARKAEDMMPQNVDIPEDMMWAQDPTTKKWKVTKKASADITKDAQDFISKHIESHMKEGMDADRAKAAAYDEARKHGYDVPEKKASVSRTAEPEMKGMPKLDLPKLDLPKPSDKPMDKMPMDKKDEKKMPEMKKEEKPKEDKSKKDMEKEEEYLAGECLKEDLDEIMGMYKNNEEIKSLLKESPDIIKNMNKLADVAIKLQKDEMSKTSSMITDANKLFASWSDRRLRKHWASIGGNVGTPSEKFERAIANLQESETVANPEAYAASLFQKVYNQTPNEANSQK